MPVCLSIADNCDFFFVQNESITRNSSGDEIANVNFLLRHRTRTTGTIKFTSLMKSTPV